MLVNIPPKRLYAWSVAVAVGLGLANAQSISVVYPTAGTSVSGAALLSATCTSCPSLYTVDYVVDDESQGIAYSTTGYKLNWDSLKLWNGNAHIKAIARDALGATIATSPVVRFSVANGYYNLSSPYIAPSAARTPSFSCRDPNTSQVLDTASNAPSTWTGTVAIACTVTGATAGEIAAGIQYSVSVGGMSAGYSTLTTATPTLNVATAKFSNGSHLVSIIARYQTGAALNNPQFVAYGQWKGLVTFSNGATPMELRANTRDKYLTTGDTWQITMSGVNTDGTAYTPSGLTYAGPAVASCTVNSSGLVTALTPTGDGTCKIRVTDSNGFYRDLYFYVNIGADVLNIGNDGQIYTNYVAGKSFFHTSIFQDAANFPISLGGYDSQYPNYGPAKLEAGFNSNEVGVGPSPTQGRSWSDYLNNGVNSLGYIITTSRNQAEPYGFYMIPIGQSLFQGNDVAWQITKGTASTWTPDRGAAAVVKAWAGVSGVKRMELGDEFNTAFGTGPVDNPPKLGGLLSGVSFKMPRTIAGTSDSPTSADCNRALQYTNGGSITVTMPDNATLPAQSCSFHIHNTGGGTITLSIGSQPYAPGFPFSIAPTTTLTSVIWEGNIGQWQTSDGVRTIAPIGLIHWPSWTYGAGNGGFIIQGATTANVNSVPGEHYGRATILYGQSGYVDPNYYEFENPNITTDAALTTGTDPNLVIENLVAWWMNSSTGKTDSTGDDPGAGPYDSYVSNDAWCQIKRDIDTISPRPAQTFAVMGATNAYGQYQWMGAASGNCGSGSTVTMSDFADFYWPSSYLGPIDPTHSATSDMATVYANEMRQRQAIMRGPRAWVAEASAVSLNYGILGYDVGITSCSDEVCAFSAPHGIGTVIPGVTRLAIRGSSAYDGNYYVFAAPDATHLKIALARPTFTAATAVNTGTITWQSGATHTLGFLNSSTTAYWGNSFGPGDCGVNGEGLTHTGETFSVSGSGDANVDAHRYVYGYDSFNRLHAAGWCHLQVWRQLPSGSSTGGTANIVPDNDYHPGYSYTTGAFVGPNAVFIAPLYVAGLGAFGIRQYTSGSDKHAFDPNNGYQGYATYQNRIWNEVGMNTQQGTHPVWDSNADGRRMWYAGAMGIRPIHPLVKYFYQPKVAAPDLGPLVDCTPGRSGSSGNLLVCLNVSDEPQVRTLTFTAACGGSTCLVTGQNFLRYVGTWQGWAVTTITAGTTSDTVTIPAGGIVMYVFPTAYSYAQPTIKANLSDVPNATKMAMRWGYDTFSLDSQTAQVIDCGTGACAVPVDPAIGRIYYRLLYLDSAGKVLSMGDIQGL